MTHKPNTQDRTENSQPLSAAKVAEICKALSHPVRLQIVAHLRRTHGCICGKIVEIFPLAQSTVSQHLKHLKRAGLVRGEVDGPRTCYCLDKTVLAQFKRAIKIL